MKFETVNLNTQDGKMSVHLHYPASSSQNPLNAIIVLQEAFGVNQNIHTVCDRFAKKGFLAIAPELFHRIKDGHQIPYSNFPEVKEALGKLSNEKLSEDLQVTYHYLKNNKNLNIGTIGIIGFCMGGFTSLLGACRLPVSYAISCYGGGLTQARHGIGFTPFVNELNQIHCPVFLLFGEKDQSIPQEQIEEIRVLLKKAQKEYEIKVYRDAGHAFLREGEKNFHPVAAADAWKDIESWLNLHVH